MKNPVNITKQVLSENLFNNFLEQKDIVKDLIMVGYDSLSDMVTDVKSKTNPLFYRDEMEQSLDEFVFIEKLDSGGVELSSPDLDNFDFSNIPIIKQIIEGTAGTYVEISYDELVKITGKTTISDDPVDSSIPLKKRIYLIRYNDFVRRKEREVLDNQLIKFPFSNTPSLEDTVFGTADEYINDNIDGWINNTIDTSIKKVQKSYRGVK